MVRSPCCEKMGLKKGPWTPEEDQILVAYIKRHGHGNWRALPKQAGLLRCGKSCRLRWINYLRPDVKRGNFSQEEEETIYRLHELLGNRWSAIAAQLPGRTDNEIKNVWHTRLKKRLDRSGETPEDRSSSAETLKCNESAERDSEPMNFLVSQELQSPAIVPVSPQHSDISSSGTDSSLVTSENLSTSVKDEHLADANDNLWSEALSAENTIMSNYFPETSMDQQLQFPFHPASLQDGLHGDSCMDFWFNLFVDANKFTELPEF